MADRPGGGAPRVDCHAHVFHREMPFAPGAHSRPDYDYRAEQWLADMAAHGITHGVIAAASLYGAYNDYTLSALAAHASLRATVILPPETPAARLRELALAGVVGVRLVWRRLERFPDLAAEPWRGFLARLADAGLHVELLAKASALPPLLAAFGYAGVPVVIDHFGAPGPGPAEALRETDAMLRAMAGRACWVKLSAGFRLSPPVARAVTDRLLAEAGTDRLLWGSDAPFVNHEDAIDYAGALALYERIVPDPGQRAAIDRTAMDLFFHERNPH